MASWKNALLSLSFLLSACCFYEYCSASEIWLVELDVVDVDSQETFSTAFCRVQIDGVEEERSEVTLIVSKGSEGSGLRWLFNPPLQRRDSLICFLEKGVGVQSGPHSIFELELVSLWGCRYTRKKSGEAGSTQFVQMGQLADFVAMFEEDDSENTIANLTKGIENSNPLIAAWSSDQLVVGRHTDACVFILKLLDKKCSTTTRAAAEFALSRLMKDDWLDDPKRMDNLVVAAKETETTQDLNRLAILLSYQAQKGLLSWHVFSETISELARSIPEAFHTCDSHWRAIGKWYAERAETEAERFSIDQHIRSWL